MVSIKQLYGHTYGVYHCNVVTLCSFNCYIVILTRVKSTNCVGNAYAKGMFFVIRIE